MGIIVILIPRMGVVRSYPGAAAGVPVRTGFYLRYDRVFSITPLTARRKKVDF